MKSIIIKEFENAIPEAEHEPTATAFEDNIMASIIIQNEEDLLSLGPDLYPKLREIS